MISLWEVLKASKGLPVSDFYAAMWGKQIAGKYTIAELEGALPLTFNANGEALIDYRIYGNTVQDGTPTPENPIMPEGVGERTENLFDISMVEQGGWSAASGSIPTKIEPGQNNYNIRTRYNRIIPLFATTLSLYCPSNIKINYVWIDANGISLGGSGFQKSGDTTTAPEQAVSMTFILALEGDLQCSPSDFYDIIIVAGSTAPESYIPYGYKLPILSDSTVTNIYLGEVQTTRRIKKLVLTGKKELNGVNILHRVAIGMRIPCISGYALGEINTHFVVNLTSEYDLASKDVYSSRLGLGGGVVWFFIPLNFFSGELNADNCKAEFKSYLAAQYSAGTPVTVWYVLEEPETGIVNEPLMKIGNYADTLSMEQAGVSIPTNKGTTVIDYEETTKPSKMYIKYLEVKK